MRLSQPQIKGHLAYILEQEKIKFDETSLDLIAKSADGSARDSLSILDQAIAYGAGEVSFDSVKMMLGLVDQQFSADILNALIKQSANDILDVVTRLSQIGVDYSALNDQLIEVFHQITLLQVLGSLVEASSLDEQTMQFVAENLTAEKVQSFYQIALLAKQDMKLAPDTRIAFEMALLRMLAFETATNTEISNSKPNVNAGAQFPSKKNITADVKAKEPQLTPSTTPQVKTPAPVTEAKKTNDDYFANLKGKISQTLGKQNKVTPVEQETSVALKSVLEAVADEVKDAEQVSTDILDISGLSWQQIIERLDIKGMEGELANSSILVEHLSDGIVLSVDPQKVKVLDLAVEQLQQVFREKLNYSVRFIESEQTHLTPNKVKLNELETKKEMAKQSIQQDEQVQNFVEIINMEVIESSIRSKK